MLVACVKEKYSQLAREHGTLGYFRGLLHCNTVQVDVKKAVDNVDANLKFLLTIFHRHVLSYACQILEISTLDGKVYLPPAENLSGSGTTHIDEHL